MAFQNKPNPPEPTRLYNVIQSGVEVCDLTDHSHFAKHHIGQRIPIAMLTFFSTSTKNEQHHQAKREGRREAKKRQPMSERIHVPTPLNSIPSIHQLRQNQKPGQQERKWTNSGYQQSTWALIPQAITPRTCQILIRLTKTPTEGRMTNRMQPQLGWRIVRACRASSRTGFVRTLKLPSLSLPCSRELLVLPRLGENCRP